MISMSRFSLVSRPSKYDINLGEIRSLHLINQSCRDVMFLSLELESYVRSFSRMRISTGKAAAPRICLPEQCKAITPTSTLPTEFVELRGPRPKEP